MTTAHDFFLLAPNGDIFHLPTNNGEVYLPGTNVGHISISRLYADTFNLDDTVFSLTVDFSYNSDNVQIKTETPSTPPHFFTPNNNLSTTETEQSSPPHRYISPTRAQPHQQLSSDDEFALKKPSTPLKTNRSEPVKTNSPTFNLSQEFQKVDSPDSEDALVFNSLPSFLFRFPPSPPQSPRTGQTPPTPDRKKNPTP